MLRRVYIDGVELLSARGQDLKSHREKWETCRFQRNQYGWGAHIHEFQLEDVSLSRLDRSTQFAVITAEKALNACQIHFNPERTGVVLGSSRGATEFLESQLRRYLQKESISVLTSPASTQGIFASAVARRLELGGSQLSVSSACATGLQAAISGMTWIQSGLVDHCLVGGAEAPLTDFTFQMFQKLRLLSQSEEAWPLRPGFSTGMVLGEGSSVCMLTHQETPIYISGFGATTEPGSLTGMNKQGLGLSRAIQQCLEISGVMPEDVDCIIGHGVGTALGDLAENNAIDRVFLRRPTYISHKWAIGHLLGAAGSASIAFAVDILRGHLPQFPIWEGAQKIGSVRHILLLAMGFGGLSSCLMISKQ